MTRHQFDRDAYKDAFAVALEDTRVMLGLTRAELSARLDWSPTRIRDYELGRRNVRVEDAALIAEALGIPLADLLPPVPTVMERVALQGSAR